MDSARPHPNPTHTPHHKGMNSINFAFGLVMAKKKTPTAHKKKRKTFPEIQQVRERSGGAGRCKGRSPVNCKKCKCYNVYGKPEKKGEASKLYLLCTFQC